MKSEHEFRPMIVLGIVGYLVIEFIGPGILVGIIIVHMLVACLIITIYLESKIANEKRNSFRLIYRRNSEVRDDLEELKTALNYSNANDVEKIIKSISRKTDSIEGQLDKLR